MRTKLLTTLLVLTVTLTIISCGGSGNYETAAVMKKWHDAIRNKDIKAYREAASTEVTMKTNNNPEGFTLDSGQDDNFMKMMLEQLQKMHTSENIELRNEKVTNDTATIEWKDSEGKWRTANLAKKEGQWKFIRTN